MRKYSWVTDNKKPLGCIPRVAQIVLRRDKGDSWRQGGQGGLLETRRTRGTRIYFESHGVTVEWMEDVLPKSYESELVEDMLSLLASFSARLYGKRSAERRKAKKSEVVTDAD